MAVHAVKSAGQPKQEVPDQKQMAYETYRGEMERNNLERSGKGLPDLAILSYDDWQRQQEMLKKIKEEAPSSPSVAEAQQAQGPLGQP